MRERVLKRITQDNKHGIDTVAPHAGACVETQNVRYANYVRWGSLPMRERVLKPLKAGLILPVLSRSPCGSVC